LVKIAKLGGGKWENEFGGGLVRVAISEGGGREMGGGGRWRVWLEISQVIPGA
jgi:hypothetical protein